MPHSIVFKLLAKELSLDSRKNNYSWAALLSDRRQLPNLGIQKRRHVLNFFCWQSQIINFAVNFISKKIWNLPKSKFNDINFFCQCQKTNFIFCHDLKICWFLPFILLLLNHKLWLFLELHFGTFHVSIFAFHEDPLSKVIKRKRQKPANGTRLLNIKNKNNDTLFWHSNWPVLIYSCALQISALLSRVH